MRAHAVRYEARHGSKHGGKHAIECGGEFGGGITTFAADLLGDEAHEVAGLDAASQVLAHARSQPHFAVLDQAEHDCRRVGYAVKHTVGTIIAFTADLLGNEAHDRRQVGRLIQRGECAAQGHGVETTVQDLMSAAADFPRLRDKVSVIRIPRGGFTHSRFLSCLSSLMS